MSIESVVNYINTLLEAMPYFSNVYGLAEIKTGKDGVRQPVIYLDGRYRNVKFNTKGTTYLRKRDVFSLAESPFNQLACGNMYRITMPIRLIATTKRTLFPADNAYSSDRLSGTLIKAVTNTTKQLRAQMEVQQVSVKAISYSTDTETVKSQELLEVSKNLPLDWIACAIDIDVVVDTYANCIEDACEYVPRFCLQLESYIALP